MKLNDKGLKRLLDVAFDGDEFYQSNALEVEFEPDDFDGGCCQNGKDHIVLTVEEAKALLRRIPEFKECGDWQLPIERLKERISKAEGK